MLPRRRRLRPSLLQLRASKSSLDVWFSHSAKVAVPCTLSASSIWEAFTRGNDSAGRKHMATIFIYVIYFLWKAGNKATFEAWKIPISSIQQQLQESLSFSLGKISKPFCSNQLRSFILFLKVPVGWFGFGKSLVAVRMPPTSGSLQLQFNSSWVTELLGSPSLKLVGLSWVR